MKKIKLFQEDECALNEEESLESFNKKMKAACGMDVDEFIDKAKTTNYERGLEHRYKKWLLEWWVDDPFYSLSEVQDD